MLNKLSAWCKINDANLSCLSCRWLLGGWPNVIEGDTLMGKVMRFVLMGLLVEGEQRWCKSW